MAIVMTTSSGDWRNNTSRPEREPDARCETTCLIRSMDISVTESIVRRELASEAAGKDVDGTLAEGLYKHTGAPGFFSWRQVYEAPSFKRNFRLIEERELQYNLIGTVESLKNHVKCWTPIAILSDAERKKVIKDVELIIDSADDNEREWIDKSRGVLRVPYDAVIPVIQKL